MYVRVFATKTEDPFIESIKSPPPPTYDMVDHPYYQFSTIFPLYLWVLRWYDTLLEFEVSVAKVIFLKTAKL